MTAAKLNEYHYAGIALMGAGAAYFAINAASFEAFAEYDWDVAAAIFVADLLVLAVFVGLGYLAYKRGDKKMKRDKN